jgi:CRISPR-associated protein Cas1
MDTLYLVAGAKIRRHDNTIEIVPKEGKARRFPVEMLKHIVVLGVTQFNSELLSFLGKQGVRLSFHDYYGYFAGSLEAANPVSSGAVHLGQARLILDEALRLSLGKTIMTAGLQNLLGNLRYYQYRGKSELAAAVAEIALHKENLAAAQSIEQMMGCEGLARQAYYAAWALISADLAIVRRSRRPPGDRINALISFCNGVVYSICKHELSKTHLDVTLSFVHAPTQARASLALDIAEIFKPVVADKVIFTLVNKQMLADTDFEESEGVCMLSEKGRRVVVEALREKLDKEKIGDLRGYRA